jgi:hypothetical protein
MSSIPPQDISKGDFIYLLWKIGSSGSRLKEIFQDMNENNFISDNNLKWIVDTFFKQCNDDEKLKDIIVRWLNYNSSIDNDFKNDILIFLIKKSQDETIKPEQIKYYIEIINFLSDNRVLDPDFSLKLIDGSYKAAYDYVSRMAIETEIGHSLLEKLLIEKRKLLREKFMRLEEAKTAASREDETAASSHDGVWRDVDDKDEHAVLITEFESDESKPKDIRLKPPNIIEKYFGGYISNKKKTNKKNKTYKKKKTYKKNKKNKKTYKKKPK